MRYPKIVFRKPEDHKPQDGAPPGAASADDFKGVKEIHEEVPVQSENKAKALKRT
jgi:hypothetical protein